MYITDRSDPKFAHPLLRESYPPVLGANPIDYYDPDIPKETKLQVRTQTSQALNQMFNGDGADPDEKLWKSYMVEKGCPEEVDAPPVQVLVRDPKNSTAEKRPVVIDIPGGGLTLCFPQLYRQYDNPISDMNGAVVVSMIYRTSIDAEYPAAVNDIHAVYQWIVENAEMLKIDSDNITLFGTSTGGHLALASAFRLKRYGYRPRGCVASIPITDDRLNKQSSKTFVVEGEWSGESIHNSSRQWLGKNYGDPNLPPEAYANYATVEECIGICPIYIDTLEMDPDVENGMEFVDKLYKAGAYVEYHLIPGCTHSMGGMSLSDPNVAEFMGRQTKALLNAVSEFITYDLRRW